MAYPKGQKLSKYVAIAYQLMEETMATQRQMQVVCGGLVYFSTFRRQLLGGLNACWAFIESFNVRGRRRLPIPKSVKLEIRWFLCLVPLRRMSFRMDLNPRVTCSDASEHGGGVCSAVGLTRFGEQVAAGSVSGEMKGSRGGRILSIGLFDGIGCLRVALDLLGCDVAGHFSVEKDPGARRVVEHHFPGTMRYPDVVEIEEKDVKAWALTYGQVELVLIGAGPPCQGVSGLNSQRKGALRDERSGLFIHVKRIQALVQKYFSFWAQVQTLMESVASMDEVDKLVMSSSFGDEPWRCDAGSLTWCNRPRLYWLSWELQPNEDIIDLDKRELMLIGESPWEESVQKGWTKVDPSFQHSHGNLDRVMVLGRWQAQKTARMYLNESRAILAEMHLGPLEKTIAPYRQFFLNATPRDFETLEPLQSNRQSSKRGLGGRGRMGKISKRPAKRA